MGPDCISCSGSEGHIDNVDINQWRYGVATGEAVVRISGKDGQPVAARLVITSEDGHPVTSLDDTTYSDPKTGRQYFYVDGEAEFSLPVGRYTVSAARGPMTPVESAKINGAC